MTLARSAESRSMNSLPRQGSPPPTGLELVEGSRRLESVVLSDAKRAEIRTLLAEWRGRELLEEYGLPPRRLVLLFGPSGNGKTTLAQAIATELKLPCAVARCEQLICSHLGESPKNVADIFRFANEVRCVLLIDEADSLVAYRRGSEEAGRELNRVVSQVILACDANRGSLIILATNAADMIDPAILRRCTIRLEIPPPDKYERAQMRRLLRLRWPILKRCPGWEAATESATSLAEIEECALAAARKFILDRGK